MNNSTRFQMRFENTDVIISHLNFYKQPKLKKKTLTKALNEIPALSLCEYLDVNWLTNTSSHSTSKANYNERKRCIVWMFRRGFLIFLSCIHSLSMDLVKNLFERHSVVICFGRFFFIKTSIKWVLIDLNDIILRIFCVLVFAFIYQFQSVWTKWSCTIFLVFSLLRQTVLP